MPYCTTNDLLLGDLAVGPRIDPEAYVISAASEIDVKLGPTYVVPVNQASLPKYSSDRLKFMNAKLATGRVILAMDSAGEHSSLHAYAMSLIQEARGDLTCIVSGRDELAGAAKAGGTDGANDGPSVLTFDRQSGVDAFYDYVNQPTWVPPVPSPMGTPWWRPGPAGGYGPGRSNDTPTRGGSNPDPA